MTPLPLSGMRSNTVLYLHVASLEVWDMLVLPKGLPTPHKNGGEQSLEPHMSKVREVAENRIFHDETNAAAAPDAFRTPANPLPAARVFK